MFSVSRISSRAGLADLLNRENLCCEAVEVGTHRGDFAAEFLSRWQGERLHCVDAWSILPGYEEQSLTLRGEGNHKAVCAAKLKSFGARARMIQATSLEAAKMFKDDSLDFVYIDADHRRGCVLADLRAWWPKVCKEGVIAGHDVVCPGEIRGGYGPDIQRALLEFSPDVEWMLVIERGLPWSFYAKVTP